MSLRLITSMEDHEKLRREVLTKIIELDLTDGQQIEFVQCVRREVEKISQNHHDLNFVLPVFQNNIVKADMSEVEDGFAVIDIDFDQDLAKLLRCLCDENLESSKVEIEAMKISESKQRVVEVLFTFVYFSNYHDPDTAKLVAKLFASIVGDTAEVEIPKGDVFPLLEHYFLFMISQLKSTLPEDPKNYVQILNGMVTFISNLAVYNIFLHDQIALIIEIFIDDSLSEHEEFADLGLSLLNMCEKYLNTGFKNHCLKRIEKVENLTPSLKSGILNVLKYASRSTTPNSYWRMEAILNDVSLEQLSSNKRFAYMMNGYRINLTSVQNLARELSLINFSAGYQKICCCLCEHRRKSNEIAIIFAHLFELVKSSQWNTIINDVDEQKKIEPMCDFIRRDFWKVLKSYMDQYFEKMSSDVMVSIIVKKIINYFIFIKAMLKHYVTTSTLITTSLKLIFETGDRRLLKIATEFVKTLGWNEEDLKRSLKLMPLTEATRKTILEIAMEQSTS